MEFNNEDRAIGEYNYLAKLYDDQYREEWKEGGVSKTYIAYVKKEGRRPSLKIVRIMHTKHDKKIHAWKFFPSFRRGNYKSIFELRMAYFHFLKNQIPKIEVMEGI